MSDTKAFLLDCTLRDGGYYNSWDFDADLVRDYLQAMAVSGIDYIELGLLGFARHGFHGGRACSTDAFLSSLPLAPAGMLPEDVRASPDGKAVLDFGLSIEKQGFGFHSWHCTLPTSQVAAHVLAVAASGRACRVLLAGFDGSPGEDPRNVEVDDLLEPYQAHSAAPELLAVTPPRYQVPCSSIYAL